MPRRVAVAGASRWASEGVAAALSGALVSAEAQPLASSAAGETLAYAMEVRAFDNPEQLHAGSRWPEVVVALVASAAQRSDIERALPAQLPVLWLVEPGAERDIVRGSATRASAWLHAESAPARWQAALAALAVGLSVHEPGLHPAAPAADLLAAPQDPLTPRELEVLELMAKGLANRDIARVLGISPHTAKFHVAQILEKTACASRTEAVALGLRQGLIGL